MRSYIVCLAVLCLSVAVTPAWADTPVVLAASAGDLEAIAAEELSTHLAKLYPGERFPVRRGTAGQAAIRLETDKSLRTPDRFVVSSRNGGLRIAGGSPRGLLYGVYALLERLGFGFYLSYTAAPPPRAGQFRLEAFELDDEPLFGDRLVFNWHNFLSSCSTWEWQDWERYVTQAARMRYSAIMMHAYGNNPVFRFSYNGQTKPVGYLATTARGRDWGTQHVNDVRRLVGGELFHNPVFGSSVALADGDRSEAKTALMKRVFALARSRGLGVTYAHDVDTESSNPQNILLTLPAAARITSGKFQLANPDSPEGYAYYREQVRQLIETYPQIDRLVVWFRNHSTPWRNLEPKDFPPAWQREFQAALDRHASLRADKEAHGMFAMAKLVGAFQRILAELKRHDIEIAYGSWRFPFLRAADLLMPKEATAIPLDWQIVFDTSESQQYFREVTASGRKTIPIVWAHHDDHTYIGRPYTPFANFSTLLRETGSDGFGIIHWTTRPLDVYFKSLSRQVWKAAENEALNSTCERMGEDSFGKKASKAGGAYLRAWVSDAPMFGRETSNRLIDQPLKNAGAMMAGCRERLKLLDKIGEGDLTESGRAHRDYFREYERFMLEFYESHTAYERAQQRLKAGDAAGARKEIEAAAPEAVIRQYVKASRQGAISRGEEALVISLNLRWLPYLVSLRQALGMEPTRVKFQPTQHEPLAQGAGSNTFFLDSERRLWKALGERETGAPAYESAGGEETCRTGIRIGTPLTLSLRPILDERFVPGRYRLDLEFAEQGGPARIELPGATHEIGAAQRSPSWPVEIEEGVLPLTIRPLGGAVMLCAATLTPLP